MNARCVAGFCVLVVASCRVVEITPRALGADVAAHPERAVALERWSAAIELANEFLESPRRLTLPRGRFELADDGMRFVTDSRTWPITVCSTAWGNWVVRTGFLAQEREWGFVVGARVPVGDELVDHSLFKDSDGALVGKEALASLVLHETTHVVHREGTIGFWNAVAYYVEAICLFRYEDHSDERHANATSEEFRFYCVERDVDDEYASIYARTFAEHLASHDPSRCMHEEPERGR